MMKNTARHIPASSELRVLRRDDFRRACKKVIADDRTGMLTERRVAEMAACGPAPRYYVTESYALRTLRYMRRHPDSGKVRSCTSALWRELRQRVEHTMAALGVSDEEAVWRVLEQGGASSFFLSASRAARLYSDCKKHKN